MAALSKRITIILLVTIAGIWISGCASVQEGRHFNRQRLAEGNSRALAHINGDVWGIYIWNVPIITGKYGYRQGPFLGIKDVIVDQPDISFTFFSDTVSLDYMADILTEKSKEMGGTAFLDMTSKRTNYWMPWALIFWYREIEISGNSVK